MRSHHSIIRRLGPGASIAARVSLLVCVGVGAGACERDVLRPIDHDPSSRQKREWPFDARSIWNQPIGSDALYKTANLGRPKSFIEVLRYGFDVAPDDPLATIYAAPDTEGVCPAPTMVGVLQIPPAFQNVNGSNGVSFLQSDGHTLVEMSGAGRCTENGTVYGFLYGQDDIRGMGIVGGEGGSGMSARGGNLLVGELTSDAPIRHALKINIWGGGHLFYDPADPTRCHRWPARLCDASAPNTVANGGYGGTDPSLVQGSLVALPPTLEPQIELLRTKPGRKLAQAFLNYGAYVVGNSNPDIGLLATTPGVNTEFQELYGYPINAFDGVADTQPFREDLQWIWERLAVVDNNAQDNIGGGGEPRAPLAPPISD